MLWLCILFTSINAVFILSLHKISTGFTIFIWAGWIVASRQQQMYVAVKVWDGYIVLNVVQNFGWTKIKTFIKVVTRAHRAHTLRAMEIYHQYLFLEALTEASIP